MSARDGTFPFCVRLLPVVIDRAPVADLSVNNGLFTVGLAGHLHGITSLTEALSGNADIDCGCLVGCKSAVSD